MATDDESPRFRTSMGERHARGVWARLYRPLPTKADLDWLVVACGSDHSRALYLFRLWEKVEAEDDGMTWEKVREEILLQWRERLDGNRDHLFVSGALSTVLESMFMHYLAINTEILISWIQPGRMGYVTGPMGSGKSDFMCLVAELWMANGGTVVSCIPLERETEGYIYTTRLTQYFRTACELALRGVPFLMLLDEAFFHAAGERPLDPKVMAYRQVLRLSRKMGIATLLASQKATDVLKDVRRWSTFHVEKLDPSHPDQTIVDMEGEIEGQRIPFYQFLRGVPPTSLPFRTEAIGTFVVDMEPLALLHVLSKADMTANQFQVTLNWLNDMGFEYTREEKRDLARKMYATGKLSQRDVAEILAVSHATVSRYLSEPH